MTLTSYPLRTEIDGGRHRLRRPGYGWVGVVSILLVAAAVLGYSLNAEPPAVAEEPTQRGFALPTWEEGGYDGPSMEQNLREMAEIGATWVQLTPTWYQANRTTSEITRTPKTVSDAGLERAITLAHQHGLNVFLKPHLDLPVPGQDSRNNIRPADTEAWFASYTAFINHYAAIAERTEVEQFAVGTELSSTTHNEAAWLQVIKTVRTSYHGVVVYAANTAEYTRVPFWDAVDLIGIDGYWTLSNAPTTDVHVLQQSWESVRAELAELAAKHGRKVLFTEAGFTSQEGTTTDPSNWRVSQTQDQTEQAAGYQTLLATFSDQPWWAGVYWWVWNALPDTEAHPLDFSPRLKEAEWVIRGWWAR